MLMEQGSTQEAMAEFKCLQDQVIKRFDPYVVMSIANIYYEWSTRVRGSSQQGDLLKKAMEKYMQVLENDEANVFAAVGVANVLAEHNKVSDALDILKGVRDATPNSIKSPNLLVNLAHLNVVQENYESAVHLYMNALERLPNGDLEIELYLAKAHFLSKSFEQC